MLKERIAKGVRIQGLFGLISDGKDPFDASWSFSSNLLSANVIKFYPDRSGKHPIKVLPYKRGENSSTAMMGGEVVSGEFTGCIMGVYKEGGVVNVNHVDTEKDGAGDTPHKEAWTRKKGQNGFQLLNEFSTLGEIPKYINGMSDSKLSKYGTGIVILCVASPTAQYTITRAVCFRDKSHDYKVLEVL